VKNRALRSLVGLVAFMLVAMAVHAGKPQLVDTNVLTMRVDGDLAIDETGHVLDYKVVTPVKSELQNLLESSVRKWTFRPVMADGKPVRAKTGMRITLAAKPAGNGYKVSIDNVIFGATSEGRPEHDEEHARQIVRSSDGKPAIVAKRMTGISYPSGLMRAGVEGAVLLSLKLDTSGNVEDAMAIQSSLYDVRGRPDVLDQARELFERSALVPARRWKFEVTPGKGTPGVDDLTVVIPVVFIMPGKGAPNVAGEWRVELRSQKRIAPWLVGMPTQDIGISDLDTNDIARVASNFRVPEGVIGQSL